MSHVLHNQHQSAHANTLLQSPGVDGRTNHCCGVVLWASRMELSCELIVILLCVWWVARHKFFIPPPLSIIFLAPSEASASRDPNLLWPAPRTPSLKLSLSLSLSLSHCTHRKSGCWHWWKHECYLGSSIIWFNMSGSALLNLLAQ